MDQHIRGGKRRWITPLITTALLCLTVLFAASLFSLLAVQFPTEWTERLFHEGGVIENTTLAIYFLSAFILFALAFSTQPPGRTSKAKYLGFAGVLLICAARELDWHQKFTTRDIFKTRYYIDGEISLVEKSLSIVAITLITILVMRMLWSNWRIWKESFLNLRLPGIATAVAITSLIASKVIDSGLGTIKRAGFTVPESLQQTLAGVEETCELVGPAIIMVLVIRLAIQQFKPMSLLIAGRKQGSEKGVQQLPIQQGHHR
jgi:hypothetical protein